MKIIAYQDERIIFQETNSIMEPQINENSSQKIETARTNWRRVDYAKEPLFGPENEEVLEVFRGKNFLVEGSREIKVDPSTTLPEQFKEDLGVICETSQSLKKAADDFDINGISANTDRLLGVMEAWRQNSGDNNNKLLDFLISALKHDVRKSPAGIKSYISSLEEESLMLVFKSNIQTLAQKTKNTASYWNNVIKLISRESDDLVFINAREELGKVREIIGAGLPFEMTKAGGLNLESGSIIDSSLTERELGNIQIPSGILSLIALNLRVNSEAVATERDRPDIFKYSYRLATEADGDHCLVVRFWDKAGGFPREYFDQTTGLPLVGETIRTGGTGVGMQIIGHLVEAMKGTIEVGNWSEKEEKEAKDGAVITIKIPLSLDVSS
ncbi:MAG: ATP-binding protein [Candidatus Shapirobacteria bacterium]|nr:ATP-binding protein [Candidatus Shapirobacteria bacterium]